MTTNASVNYYPPVEVKPCPFCGGPARLIFKGDDKSGLLTYILGCSRALCPAADALSGYIDGFQTAVHEWNRRIVRVDQLAQDLSEVRKFSPAQLEVERWLRNTVNHVGTQVSTSIIGHDRGSIQRRLDIANPDIAAEIEELVLLYLRREIAKLPEESE